MRALILMAAFLATGSVFAEPAQLENIYVQYSMEGDQLYTDFYSRNLKTSLDTVIVSLHCKDSTFEVRIGLSDLSKQVPKTHPTPNAQACMSEIHDLETAVKSGSPILEISEIPDAKGRPVVIVNAKKKSTETAEK